MHRAGLQFAVLIFGAAVQAQDTTNPALFGCKVDESRMVVLSEKPQRKHLLPRTFRVRAATIEQIEQAECVLQAFHKRCQMAGKDLHDSLMTATKGQVSPLFEAAPLDCCYRQYLGGEGPHGDVLLFVNGFCRTDDRNWKSGWLMWHDGGPCYWHAVINLTRGRIERLGVNGVG